MPEHTPNNDPNTPDDDATLGAMSESQRQTASMSMLHNLFGGLGPRVPICLIGLTYNGDLRNPEELRIVMPVVLKHFLGFDGAADSMKAAFCHAIDVFVMHPEDRGPVGPGGPSGL